MSVGVRLINDAPYNGINFFSISFVDPINYKDAIDIPDASKLTTRGFVVYDGYNLEDQANDHVKKIKKTHVEHDITIGEVGKLHEWNDKENADKIEYQRKELNQMEIARRENIEKMKVVSEQLQNDKFKPGFRPEAVNEKEKTRERILKTLLSNGKITPDDYHAKLKGIAVIPKKQISSLEKIEIMERVNAETNDNLPEFTDSAFEFGCISFFDPIVYKGLTKFCFKIRGFADSKEEINIRIANLKRIYPHDNIHRFEIGKWCALPGPDTIDANKELNYMMKLHIQHMSVEKEQFDVRKKKMLEEIEKEKADVKSKQSTAPAPIEKPKKPSFITKEKEQDGKDLFNPRDKPDIDMLTKFLEEDAGAGFKVKGNKTMTVDGGRT